MEDSVVPDNIDTTAPMSYKKFSKTTSTPNITRLDSILMSPNARQRKTRLSKEPFDMVQQWNLEKGDSVEVITLSLKNLGLLDAIKKPSLSYQVPKGRK